MLLVLRERIFIYVIGNPKQKQLGDEENHVRHIYDKINVYFRFEFYYSNILVSIH